MKDIFQKLKKTIKLLSLQTIVSADNESNQISEKTSVPGDRKGLVRYRSGLVSNLQVTCSSKEDVLTCEKNNNIDRNVKMINNNSQRLEKGQIQQSCSFDSNISSKNVTEVKDVEYVVSDGTKDKKSKEELISSLVNLLEELDLLVQKSQDENVLSTIDFCQNRLFEILLSNGCSLIENEKMYDNTRHTTRPFIIPICNAVIVRYKRKGLIYNGKVLLKAVVQVNNECE